MFLWSNAALCSGDKYDVAGRALSATLMCDASLLSSRYLTRFRPMKPHPPKTSTRGLPAGFSSSTTSDFLSSFFSATDKHKESDPGPLQARTPHSRTLNQCMKCVRTDLFSERHAFVI